MSGDYNKVTIVSMAAIAASLALHKGLGHGVTAWLRVRAVRFPR